MNDNRHPYSSRPHVAMAVSFYQIQPCHCMLVTFYFEASRLFVYEHTEIAEIKSNPCEKTPQINRRLKELKVGEPDNSPRI